MIQIDRYTFDPTGLDVAGAKRGQAGPGDGFANILGSNFELVSPELKPSLRPRPERVHEQQDVSEAKTAPGGIAEDEKGAGQVDSVETTSETDSKTPTDEIAAVDSEATDQPSDSHEDVPDKDKGDEKKVAGLLGQLAGDVKAQQAQQQVVAAVDKTVAATPIKVIAPEPVAADAGVDKMEAKVLANEAQVAKAATVEQVADAVDENVVVENTAKPAATEVAPGRVPVEANGNKDVTVEVDQAPQDQLKAVAKNNGEALNSDVQSHARGSSHSDLASADSAAKEASGFIATVVTKEQKVEVKKADHSLMGSIHEVSVGKADSGRGGVPESRLAPAESLISREQVEQVVKMARMAVSRGSSQIQLRLDPPELGLLRIEIKQNASGLQLQLQATTTKAFQLLEQSSGHLHSVLESQGFHAAQIEVQLRTDLRNDQSMDQQQTDQFNQRHGFGQGENFSEGFKGMFEDQLVDSGGDESSVDAGVDVLEIQSGSKSPERWREMEFSNFDVVI